MKHKNVIIFSRAFVFSLALILCNIPIKGEEGNQHDSEAVIETHNTQPPEEETDIVDNNRYEPQRGDGFIKPSHKGSIFMSTFKTFVWGFLLGIIATWLCTNHKRVKNKYKKIMSAFNSKKMEKEDLKISQENDMATCDGNNTDIPTGTLQGTENSIPQENGIKDDEPTSSTDTSEFEKKEEKEIKPLSPYTFAVKNDAWSVVGTSIIGKSHMSMNLPCQDSCKYKYLGDGWGIAITSDGAGSAKRSEVGSRILVERGILHFEQLIEEQGWKKNEGMPSDVIWQKMAYITLHKLYNEIIAFGQTKKLDYKDLSATIIVLIHTPHGILCTHIGDGRAGYRTSSGDWKSLLTPHKGEEANQTIFITSDFWNQPNYVMSDVFVPQSVVVRDIISAFTLMSDGCEHTMWECNYFDNEKQRYYDPNQPFAKLYESLCSTLVHFSQEHLELNVIAENWQRFITEGNNSFKKESDDKTLILGVLCK